MYAIRSYYEIPRPAGRFPRCINVFGFQIIMNRFLQSGDFRHAGFSRFCFFQQLIIALDGSVHLRGKLLVGINAVLGEIHKAAG